jgi:hypothetical protein
VGSLFAVIGNKYIIDSSLPDSTSFTLVDTLHGITLFFILVVVAASAYSLRLLKQNKIQQSIHVDNVMAVVVLASYLLLNAYFIYRAANGL